DLYVGKVLYVDAGESLSLQLATSGPGEAVHLAAGVLHRLIAEEDLVLAEVSTAFSGCKEDIVRV
ncbi:MAG: hypothetical protein ACXVYS_14485, partial [Oryzihumus sp.]